MPALTTPAIGLREPSAKPARAEEEASGWRGYLTAIEEGERRAATSIFPHTCWSQGVAMVGDGP